MTRLRFCERTSREHGIESVRTRTCIAGSPGVLASGDASTRVNARLFGFFFVSCRTISLFARRRGGSGSGVEPRHESEVRPRRRPRRSLANMRRTTSTRVRARGGVHVETRRNPRLASARF